MFAQDLLAERLALYESDSFIASNDAFCCIGKASNTREGV
jgi:hypothetical protein